MKTVAALSLLATPAMAFFSQKPAAKAPAAPTFSIDTIPGAIEPTGLWDPLGFAEKADEYRNLQFEVAKRNYDMSCNCNVPQKVPRLGCGSSVYSIG